MCILERDSIGSIWSRVTYLALPLAAAQNLDVKLLEISRPVRFRSDSVGISRLGISHHVLRCGRHEEDDTGYGLPLGDRAVTVGCSGIKRRRAPTVDWVAFDRNGWASKSSLVLDKKDLPWHPNLSWVFALQAYTNISSIGDMEYVMHIRQL
jgi:hypothetical protein